MEQLDYNLLFRWFVGLSPDDPIWHPGPSESQAQGSWCGHAGAGYVGTPLVPWPSFLPVPI